MDKIKLVPEKETDIEEFIKSICFVSDKITAVKEVNGIIEIEISDENKSEDLRNKLINIMKKFNKQTYENSVYFRSTKKINNYFEVNQYDTEVTFWKNGQVSFARKGKFLMDFFDEIFRKVAISMEANEKLYPTLLPIHEYLKTGYIKKSPQCAIFCSTIKDDLELIEGANENVRHHIVHKIIKEPQFALSPSACFHTYIEYSGKKLDKNTMVTFRQNVFRNEGRLNYNEIGRLCDYQVREIVMIGSEEYVNFCRNTIMNKTVEIMERYGLIGDISLASDSFVVPKMQKYKKIQGIDKSKYETHLYIEPERYISTASFNLHGRAFTDPFDISVKGEKETVTACVGYGLQRWVIAYFSQYGIEEENWPTEIANAYKENKY